MSKIILPNAQIDVQVQGNGPFRVESQDDEKASWTFMKVVHKETWLAATWSHVDGTPMDGKSFAVVEQISRARKEKKTVKVRLFGEYQFSAFNRQGSSKPSLSVTVIVHKMELLDATSVKPIDGLDLPVESVYGSYKQLPEQNLMNILTHKKAINQTLDKMDPEHLRMFGYNELAEEKEKKQTEELARQVVTGDDLGRMEDIDEMPEATEESRKRLSLELYAKRIEKQKEEDVEKLEAQAQEAMATFMEQRRKKEDKARRAKEAFDLETRKQAQREEEARVEMERQTLERQKQQLVGNLEVVAAMIGGGSEATRVDGSGSSGVPLGGISTRLERDGATTISQLKGPVLSGRFDANGNLVPYGDSNATDMEGVTQTGVPPTGVPPTGRKRPADRPAERPTDEAGKNKSKNGTNSTNSTNKK
ncbi:hypothetical protein BGX29_011356 [Mortierella sp. GBA35]|nr:hypothetical protein BGX29_011356 [Mortierella sp. GBA35]